MSAGPSFSRPDKTAIDGFTDKQVVWGINLAAPLCLSKLNPAR